MYKNNVIANPRSSGGSYNPEYSSRDNPVNIKYPIGIGIATLPDTIRHLVRSR